MTRQQALRTGLRGLTDQALSSASNLLLAIAVARSATPLEFGHFGVAYILLYGFVGIGRSIVGTVASVTSTDWTDADGPRMHAVAISAAAQIGVLGSVLCLVVMPFASPGLATYLVVTAVALPFVMAQDASRFVGFAAGRPSVAIAADGAWLLVQLLSLGVMALTPASGVAVFAAWAAASVPGLALAAWMLRIEPRHLVSTYWFHRNARLIRTLWAEGVVSAVAAQGAPLAAGLTATVVATGQMRAVSTAFGPLVAMSSGLLLATVPVSSRRYALGNPRFWRPLMTNGASLACAAMAWTGVVLAIPPSFGAALLGDNWAAVPTLALAQGAVLIVSYLGDVALLSLRVMRFGGIITAIRTVSGLSAVVAAGVGSAWDGARGALVLMAVVAAITSGTAWLMFLGRRSTQPMTEHGTRL